MLKTYIGSVFYRHDTGVGHPETPRRLDAAVDGVGRAGLAKTFVRDVTTHPDAGRIIARVPSLDYGREFETACRAGMRLFHSLDNPISSSSFAAARGAVAEALAAGEDISSDGERRGAGVLA